MSGTIHGRVMLDGRPVPNAMISVCGTQRGAVTNECGDFYITEVPAGMNTVYCKVTLERERPLVNVKDGQMTNCELVL